MSSQTPEDVFRITTERIVATVVLAKSAPIEGSFSCAKEGRGRPGYQQIEALLDDTAHFVPFFPDGQRGPLLVHKASIRWVETPLPEDEPGIEAWGEDHPVVVSLDDGTEISGSIRVSAPPGHTRTLDSLNESARFVVLRTDECLLLLNLRTVVLVRDWA